MKSYLKLLFVIGGGAVFLFGCNNHKITYSYNIDTPTEVSQQIGDAMAGIDESGGATSGDITKATPFGIEKSYARVAPSLSPAPKPLPIYSLLIPPALAGTCTTVAYGTCSTTFTLGRSISGCTTAASGGTLNGTILLTFAGTGQATCTIPATNDTVTRQANISVHGLRGTEFGSRPSATGQVITRTGASTFTYNDTGTTRSFTDPDSKDLLNLTMTTPTALAISGTNRNGRTITGGDILVTNNLTAVTCDFAPAGVTWGAANCNCPTSGTWTATCSDTTSFSVAFTGTCGQANIVSGSTSSTVTMDRCDTN